MGSGRALQDRKRAIKILLTSSLQDLYSLHCIGVQPRCVCVAVNEGEGDCKGCRRGVWPYGDRDVWHDCIIEAGRTEFSKSHAALLSCQNFSLKMQISEKVTVTFVFSLPSLVSCAIYLHLHFIMSRISGFRSVSVIVYHTAPTMETRTHKRPANDAETNQITHAKNGRQKAYCKRHADTSALNLDHCKQWLLPPLLVSDEYPYSCRGPFSLSHLFQTKESQYREFYILRTAVWLRRFPVRVLCSATCSSLLL